MKYLKIICLLLLLFGIKEISAQITLSDPTFSLVFSDDFNAINTTTWCQTYCWGPVSGGGGQEIVNPNNVIYSGGYVKLKCEKLTTPDYYNSVPYYYRSGAIQCAIPFKYGYWEISAKSPVGKGYWYGFFNLGQSSSAYNEIDIFENNGNESTSGTNMGMHYHYGVGCNCTTLDPEGGSPAIVSNVANEHKYAVLWEPDKITWYFDDVQIGVLHDVNITQNALTSNPILDFAISQAPNDPNGSTTFPAYFEINYIKISQLLPDCNTVESICNFNSGTYTFKVKKSISIGGSSCTSSINTSSNLNLWATDFILLDEGTTITDNGSGSFSANTTPCPN